MSELDHFRQQLEDKQTESDRINAELQYLYGDKCDLDDQIESLEKDYDELAVEMVNLRSKISKLEEI